HVGRVVNRQADDGRFKPPEIDGKKQEEQLYDRRDVAEELDVVVGKIAEKRQPRVAQNGDADAQHQAQDRDRNEYGERHKDAMSDGVPVLPREGRLHEIQHRASLAGGYGLPFHFSMPGCRVFSEKSWKFTSPPTVSLKIF